MALPGNGTIPAPYSERLRFAKDTGEQVARGARARPASRATSSPTRPWATPWPPTPAWAAAPTPCCTSPPSRRRRAWTSTCGRSTRSRPRCRTSARSPRPAPHHMEDLYFAGGIQAVMNRLIGAGLMDGSALSVAGGTVGEAVGRRPRARRRGHPPARPPVARHRRPRRALRQPRARRRRGQGGRRGRGDAAPQRPGPRVREREGGRRRHLRARHRRRLRDRHPRRGPQGRARHARDAQRHVHARRPGPGQGRRPHHRRPLQRRHAWRRHRPRRRPRPTPAASSASCRTATPSASTSPAARSPSTSRSRSSRGAGRHSLPSRRAKA